jgi:hypothetical protein
MKAFLTLITAVTLVATAEANDTIPILNTVFRGINTVVNIFKPTTVVVTPATNKTVVVQPTTQPVTIVTPTPTIYYINGRPMIIQNGCYVPYVIPTKPIYRPAVRYHKIPAHRPYNHHPPAKRENKHRKR